MQNLNISPGDASKELAIRELSRRRFGDFIHYVFPTYRENWHHSLIISKLEAVERGEIRKLMITLPPRHGKSELVSIHFPAWFFGRNPTKSIIASSYSSDLAVTFGRKARNLVNSEDYKILFPKVSLAEDSKAAGQWNTNEKGEYTAVGIGGAITGRGADIFIIDDPVKNKEEATSPIIQERNWEWYRSVARTRLSPNGAMVLLLTRWDDADLAGKILEAESDWEVVNLPAIAQENEKYRARGEALWEAQYPLTELEAIRAELGSELWSALYQQDPVSGESQVFKKSMFRYRTEFEVKQLNTRCIVTIDPAPAKSEKADYIGVCVNYIDSENFWNFKAYQIKFDASQLINLFFRLYAEERFETVGIEKGMYFDVIKPFLDEEMLKRNIFFTVTELDHGQRNKENRIKGLVPRYEAHQIFHIEGQCTALEQQLLRFPRAVHDDVCDAAAYQLQVAGAYTQKPIGTWQEKSFDTYE